MATSVHSSAFKIDFSTRSSCGYRQDQDVGKSATLVLAIVGTVIGVLFWRCRKAPKEDASGPSTSQPKVPLSCSISHFVLWEGCG